MNFNDACFIEYQIITRSVVSEETTIEQELVFFLFSAFIISSQLISV